MKEACKLKDFVMKFKFTDVEDRDKVLEIGCFHIASHLFVVRTWQPFIEAEIE